MNKSRNVTLNIFHTFDPTNEALINAFKFAIPCIVGAFCWVYLDKPFTFFISFVPAVSFFTILPYSTYKDKFLSLTSYLLFMAILQLIIAIFYLHPIIMMILLFIAIFFAVAKTKYRYSIIFAILWAVIYIIFPQGSNIGIIRTIGIMCIAIIVVVFVFIYEYIFSKIIIRSSIVYLTEIIADGFHLFTTSEKEINVNHLRNKYIFVSPLNFRPEATVEELFLTDSEKIAHRLLMEMVNKGKFINKEEFYFRKNIEYRNFIHPIYIRLRRIFRDSIFLLKYNDCKKEILKFLPTTEFLINDLDLIFTTIITSLKFDNNSVSCIKSNNIKKWKTEYDLFLKSDNVQAGDDTLEALFGLKCIITDIEIIYSLLSAKR